MAYMLRLKIVFLLIMAIVPFGHALAAPYSYQFTGGGLTGTWTTEPPNTGGFWRVLDFNITTPFGDVWDSRDPDLVAFENRNFGSETIFFYYRSSNVEEVLDFQTDGPTTHNLNMPFGTYFYRVSGSGDLFTEGTGGWKLVPGPDTLWSFGLGMLALSLVMRMRNRYNRIGCVLRGD